MKQVSVFFLAFLLNAVLLSVPGVSAQESRQSVRAGVEEIENYLEREREAAQEWRENRQEIIKKRMAQYRFEQKYLSDG